MEKSSYADQINNLRQQIRDLQEKEAQERVGKVPDVTGKYYQVSANEYWFVIEMEDVIEDGSVLCKVVDVRVFENSPSLRVGDTYSLEKYHIEKCETTKFEFAKAMKVVLDLIASQSPLNQESLAVFKSKKMMESQKAELRLRLKKYMENSNGEGCWDLYIGSEMEADIIAFVLQELEPPSTEEITDAVDNISLLSTAPDAETPEWMKTDIKGGIDWALNFYRQKSRSVNPTDTLKELFKRNDG